MQSSCWARVSSRLNFLQALLLLAFLAAPMLSSRTMVPITPEYSFSKNCVILLVGLNLDLSKPWWGCFTDLLWKIALLMGHMQTHMTRANTHTQPCYHNTYTIPPTSPVELLLGKAFVSHIAEGSPSKKELLKLSKLLDHKVLVISQSLFVCLNSKFANAGVPKHLHGQHPTHRESMRS